ncbi:MAG TPA: hypothetical protein VGK71_05905 [Nitrospirota bacterium]
MIEDKVREKMDALLLDFVIAMRELYGEDLVSLYRFGDSSTPLGRPKLLALMRQIGLEQLRKYAAVNSKWAKKGIAAPLMLTRKTLETSADVFPMEFLEMKETGRLLYGEDLLSGLEIGLDNMRRQCEEQVKGKMLHLRQGYMEIGGNAKETAALIAASIEPFTEVMRNVLRLMSKPVPQKKDAIIAAFCTATGISEKPFAEALRLYYRVGKLPDKEVDALFSRYLYEVGLMAEKIDNMVPGV